MFLEKTQAPKKSKPEKTQAIFAPKLNNGGFFSKNLTVAKIVAEENACKGPKPSK